MRAANEIDKQDRPESRRRIIARRWITRRMAIGAAITLAVAGGAIAVVALTIHLIPMARPDIWEGEISEISTFIIEPEFNRLPTQERLNYLVEFAQRFRDFDQNDAAVLATFISDMNRRMREQAEENMRRLATDLMIENAQTYQNVPASERQAFLEKFIMDMEKLGETLINQERDETDEERLARLKRDAQRDRDREQKDASSRLDPGRVGSFFGMYEQMSAEGAQSGMSPVQKGQVARLILDLTRHMRGEKLGP